MTPSHSISTLDNDKIVIHDLEVFCAYDPAMDSEIDSDLKDFDNDRVKEIVLSTRQHMAKGSFPRLVVMHEKDGNEPKSSVGRFTKLNYEERNGVGYIVGDCEMQKTAFDKLLATNSFPRRSAEIWQDYNHLSEVALLGRETPRRPLPDTHFQKGGKLLTFSRPTQFTLSTAGGGAASTYIPSITKEKNTMANTDQDLRSEMDSLKAAMSELTSQFKKRFGGDEKDEEKEMMGADDMIQQQFEHNPREMVDEGDDDENFGMSEAFPSSYSNSMKNSRTDHVAMRRENSRMSRELAEMKQELLGERFSRELDAMESEGYRIPSSRRGKLIQDLVQSSNPEDLIDTWREMFSRDPMGIRVDMSRAKLPKHDLDSHQISALVREFAGKPEEFAKAINSRISR